MPMSSSSSCCCSSSFSSSSSSSSCSCPASSPSPPTPSHFAYTSVRPSHKDTARNVSLPSKAMQVILAGAPLSSSPTPKGATRGHPLTCPEAQGIGSPALTPPTISSFETPNPATLPGCTREEGGLPSPLPPTPIPLRGCQAGAAAEECCACILPWARERETSRALPPAPRG